MDEIAEKLDRIEDRELAPTADAQARPFVPMMGESMLSRTTRFEVGRLMLANATPQTRSRRCAHARRPPIVATDLCHEPATNRVS